MQLSTTVLLALAATLASAGQVNFYSDSNCQNYIGERHPASFVTTGSVFPAPLPILSRFQSPPSHLQCTDVSLPSGPANSFSALWVTGDQTACSSTCGPFVICGDANCSRRRATGTGKCVSFNAGVWARNGCGQDMCNTA
jgi:hypothetical protein